MLTLQQFKDRFPEFKAAWAAGDALVQAALDDAAARTDADVFGDLANEAHGYLTADILASKPTGREARHKMTGAPLPSLYAIKRRELEHLVGAGWGNLATEE